MLLAWIIIHGPEMDAAIPAPGHSLFQWATTPHGVKDELGAAGLQALETFHGSGDFLSYSRVFVHDQGAVEIYTDDELFCHINVWGLCELKLLFPLARQDNCSVIFVKNVVIARLSLHLSHVIPHHPKPEYYTG
jgi:hypothetical protein